MSMPAARFAAALRLAMFGALFFAGGTAAQAGRGDKVGSSSGTQLLIPVGARGIGLGSSMLATVSGSEAIYWNPAGLARSGDGAQVFVSHMAYVADIGVDYIALSTRLGDLGAIGLAVKSLSVGSIPVTTEDQPDGTGESTTPTFMVIGGTFARSLSDQIAIGITTNFLLEKMGEVSASGLALSAGIQYLGLGGVPGLNFGVAVKNVGPQLTFGGDGLLRTGQLDDVTRPDALYKVEAASSDLPSTIEIGLGYTRLVADLSEVSLTGMFQNNNFASDEYRFGLEYAYNKLFFVRGGYAFSSADGEEEYIYGSSAGAGIRTSLQGVTFSIDYGYREVKYLKGNHVFTVAMEL